MFKFGKWKELQRSNTWSRRGMEQSMLVAHSLGLLSLRSLQSSSRAVCLWQGCCWAFCTKLHKWRDFSFYQQPVLILLIWAPSASVPMEAFFFWELVSLGPGSSSLWEQEGVGCALLRHPAFGSCFLSRGKEQNLPRDENLMWKKKWFLVGACQGWGVWVPWLCGWWGYFMRKQLGVSLSVAECVTVAEGAAKGELGLHSYRSASQSYMHMYIYGF